MLKPAINEEIVNRQERNIQELKKYLYIHEKYAMICTDGAVS